MSPYGSSTGIPFLNQPKASAISCARSCSGVKSAVGPDPRFDVDIDEGFSIAEAISGRFCLSHIIGSTVAFAPMLGLMPPSCVPPMDLNDAMEGLSKMAAASASFCRIQLRASCICIARFSSSVAFRLRPLLLDAIDAASITPACLRKLGPKPVPPMERKDATEGVSNTNSSGSFCCIQFRAFCISRDRSCSGVIFLVSTVLNVFRVPTEVTSSKPGRSAPLCLIQFIEAAISLAWKCSGIDFMPDIMLMPPPDLKEKIDWESYAATWSLLRSQLKAFSISRTRRSSAEVRTVPLLCLEARERLSGSHPLLSFPSVRSQLRAFSMVWATSRGFCPEAPGIMDSIFWNVAIDCASRSGSSKSISFVFNQFKASSISLARFSSSVLPPRPAKGKFEPVK